ncbi:hypothetical protein [Alteribacter populi]|uniref:hypothetical protein n=1 Tax=Alteribacter populi TaxID=2011011 RepID=UPI000BBAFDC8|nr:hypothetical protein [Alteribacter populi]
MSWLALTGKEIRQNTFLMALNLVFLIAVFSLVWYGIEKASGLIVFFSIPVLVMHSFYLFFMILLSLRREWKDRTALIWFNLPQRGWKLLTSKFAAAFTAFTLSLLFSMTSLYFLMKKAGQTFEERAIPGEAEVIATLSSLYSEYFLWIFAFIAYAALPLGLAGLFIYVLGKVIRPLGWLLGIGIAIGASYVWSLIIDTGIYSAIAYWGPILTLDNIPNELMVDITAETAAINQSGEVMEVVYLGNTLIELGLMAAIFIGISWLFDRKVEI